jgi:SpoIID/LytB domain protein
VRVDAASRVRRAVRRLKPGTAVGLLGLYAWAAVAVSAGQATAKLASGPAYRLIELPSGRVIAESRPDILATPVAPGSLLKLATVVAAVEGGLVDEQTRISCPRTVVVDGRALPCAHPDLHRPLSAAEALGYSCNGFFAIIARRLSRQSLDAVLVRLGLPPLAASVPVVSGSLGVGGVRATPPQLLEAFLRVVESSRHEVGMPDAARRILRTGTELAARSGTASALAAAGFSGLAKTGTAPMAGGGYAGVVTAVVNTELPTHAIVVVAPGAAGSDAAEIAAQLLARHGAPRGPARVRVGVARREGGYDVSVMNVEEYVSRVVAGEMGGDAPASALETMAITARTFLEANRGRHAAEGFDVCDLTHCQVLGRPRAVTDSATRSTAGLVLTEHGRPARVYYSGWCGGHTETPSRAWRGARDAAYLPAHVDSACAGEAPWTSEISEPDLRRVLQSAGLRGDRVLQFSVRSRHPSGRAAELGVVGMVPGRLDAGAFSSAAGRLLGWQAVKSTLFDVRRSGSGFVLTGRGSGHGVGLCLRGAINRAREGASRDQILAAYFPGLPVSPRSQAVEAARAAPAAAANVRVMLPEADRGRLGATRTMSARVLGEVATRLAVAPPAPVDLVFHPTVEAYTRATGQPWWTAGKTSGFRVDLLPLSVLETRNILEPTIRHELTHVLADVTLAGRPLWVREGLAVYIAGELPREESGQRSPAGHAGRPCPPDSALRSSASPDAWRQAYDDAGRCVARALAAGVRWQDLR